MRRLLAAALGAAAVACSKGPTAMPRPPRAEFLIANADSTFWVGSDTAVRVRGVPILLAHYDGRFYELYTADDDHSYPQALLLGERLYRRDIATGDSAVVFADTTVGRIAASYARSHPDARPLAPDEDGDPDPETAATSQIDVLGVLGPYVSFEYHVDVDLPGTIPWHATRRGVLDLRTGHPTTVAELFGASIARAVIDSGRHDYETARDSLLADSAESSSPGIEALRHFHFDERSFALSAVDGRATVTFDVPGRGEGPEGNSIELDPITVQSPPWWVSVAPPLPAFSSENEDRWDHAGYRVRVRYDSVDETARVSLEDSTTHREWDVVTMLGPIRDLTWLDDPPISAADRANLSRAFTTAAAYDQSSRVALRSTPSVLRPAAYAPRQDRPRKPARNVRADDARARQQHGPRVRRSGPLDDGQGRGDRGLPSQSRERRHGLDRSRGFSPADPSGRSPGHEGERELRRSHVHGSRRAR
jgi:hypothetical protein